ncbi:acetyltransferase [Clostridium botulinum]|uniref:Acetyltransferase n=1 Tax=Clostridium botulinum TaxID=1491 RepID=A0A846JB62_CLOBO|nr:acyltransferase family protein [Clostridium botulinum]ACA54663.1 O-acetyltransferase OatA [Clostridium botulinum A3 str. Loch Maree]NFH64067.1 acetyltransferase [Clostridium botulinum]NFJ07354.1 acetyltransferase [Clostridium botulinum]NFK14326.1 acetyltransferase [Clostridium botulinum]NFM92776.1 acetyltransferase [Clostridium botulinum]
MHNRCYITGLDGIRAFGILFVTFYHFGFSWAKGGFLGVDIFFVLSGYLITSKILLSDKNFKVKTFSKGRLRRLLPPAYLMIIVTVLWTMLLNRRLLANLLGDTISSISYTTNWWFISHKLSYFDSFGSPSPLKHIWFLAVQEQFYILWPFILIAGLKITKKTNQLSNIIFIGALFSAALMGILYNPTADPSRVYYGTDTRAFELLIGSFLAAVLSNKKPITKKGSIRYIISLNLISIITFSIFIFSAIFIDEFNAFLYRGGLFLFSLNSALLISCICHPKGILGPILSWVPLRWIGTRSYGIYLWHYPIMVLSTPVYEIGNPSYLRVFLQLTLTCIIGEFSYRFIELPIRKLGLRKYYTLTLAKKNSTIISFIVIISLAIVSITKINLSSQEDQTSSLGINKTQINQKHMSISTENNDLSSNKENSPAAIKYYKNILALGDSIMLDITPNLNKKYNNITIDGKIGRQMSEAITLTAKYATFNASDKAVIIQLGTNGYFTNKQIDELLESFSKAHIFLINTRVPRSWESKVNKLLKEKAEERDNVTLIDWYSTASKNPGYFEPDGVHLNSNGSQALLNLISENLKIK